MKQTGFRVRCIYKKDLALRLSLDCLATSYSTGRSVLKEADGQFRVPSALVSLTSVFAPESSVGTRISLRRRRLSVTGVSLY